MSSSPKNAKLPQQASLDITLKFLQVSMNNVEQLVNFQISTSREHLDNYAKSIQALSQASNPQEALSQISDIAKANANKAMECSGEFCGILSKAQEELQDLALEHLSSVQNSLQNMASYLHQPAGETDKKK
ncbi:MAG: phasin family protein [Aquitalea sp.]|nr:phasin family protein [Aquitalea sp.]